MDSEMDREGKLILVATPIGNLEDMTFRAVRILKEADLIAAEDTRTSFPLMKHYGIETPMTSYHEHNKKAKEEVLLERLRKGETIALITDAGLPGISDPGEELVAAAHREGIEVSILPGATASLSALVISGLPTRRFVFEGFLPMKNKEREERLQVLRREERTAILYEAPHRLRKTLAVLLDVLGDRPLTLVRELTKRYEEVLPGTISEHILRYEASEPRGEYVLILGGRTEEEILEEKRERYARLSVKEQVEKLLASGMEEKEALRAVARERGCRKQEIYKAYKGF